MIKRLFVILLVSLNLLLLPVSGQQPAPQSKPANPTTAQQPPPRTEQDDVIRVTTSLVQIDAVVIRDGKQVTDLTAEDFEILEDGRPQTITNFSFVSNVTGVATPANPAASSPAKSSTGAPVLPAIIRPQVTRRTIAIVVDDLGISLESIPRIKQQLRKFVAEELQPNDLVAIIRTGGEVGALQQFTTDKQLLNRAVEALRWNPCGRVGISSLAPQANLTMPNATLGTGQNGVGLCADVFGGPLRATIRSLRFILQGMRDLPGRKSMVILSDNLPADVPDADLESLRRGPIKAQNPIADSPDADLVLEAGETRFGNEAALRRTAEIANRSSVVIYAVDTRGLQVTGITATDNLSPSGPGIRPKGTAYLNAATLATLGTRATQLQNGRAGMDLITRQTGGFMVSNSNDFGLPRVLQDQEGYYLIGYRPSGETFNRNFHQIKARVKRSGFTVRTREGFFGLNDKDVMPIKPTNRDRLNQALMSPFGAVQIEIRLTALFANTKQTGSIIRSLVHFNARDLTFADEADGWRQASFSLSGVLFGDNGSVVHQANETRTVRVDKKDYERILRDGLVYQLDMPAKKAGAYQFRVAVRDPASSKVGTAGQLVEVPDLRDQRLAVSGITVSGDLGSPASSGNASGTTAAPGDARKDNTMANPAVRRFHQGSGLFYGYVIYMAQLDKVTRLPKLTAQVRLFRDGEIVYTSQPKQVDATGQTDLERITAGGGLQLNQTLPAGSYILQIVVNDPLANEKHQTATQWIDFEVVP
ncbi:MAG: VWA domain-containing protein [Pyrinomonadaceae bacterium]